MSDDISKAEGADQPRRETSVRLRDGTGSDEASAAQLMDPANQSLAEALKITYRLLQVAMGVLVVLFVFSGAESVREGSQGLRLVFGKLAGENLSPGLKISAPYPIGELIKVDVGARRMELDTEFMPHLSSPEDRNKSEAELAQSARASLDPDTDGSNLTADGNVAHTSWSIVYRRSDPTDFERNISHDFEERIVRAAVMRGVVRSVSEVDIEDLLKESPGESGTVASRAKRSAQEMLDEMSSGLEIERLDLVKKIPPRSVAESFEKVQSAQAEASRLSSEAQSERQRILSQVAGQASKELIALIDDYEQAVELNQREAQTSVLGEIVAVLEGRPNPEGFAATGEVTSILSEARQYRSSVVSRARGDLTLFRAKQVQFENNPSVMVANTWSEAYATWVAQDTLQKFFLPAGINELVIHLNPDPSALKAIEKAVRQRQYEQEQERIRREQARSRNTTTKTDPDAPKR